MSKAIVLLAGGFEEIEAIVPIDLLRRGGVEVALVGIQEGSITGSHGVRLETDEDLTNIHDFLEYDAVVLPGGMPGSTNLSESWEVNELVVRMFNDGKIIGAICAAPAVVLGKLGILNGKTAVCYPGAESHAPESVFSDISVARDGNLITAQGAGYAAEFGLELLRALEGDAVADKVGKATLFR